MEIENLKIANFQECMKSAQRSIYIGLAISVFAFLLASGQIKINNHTLPVLNLTVSSLNTALFIVSILFFYSGLHCSFFVSRAYNMYIQIVNKELSAIALYGSSLVNSNKLYYFFLFMALVGPWYGAFLHTNVFNNLWAPIICGGLISSPYFYALRIGKYLRPKG